MNNRRKHWQVRRILGEMTMQSVRYDREQKRFHLLQWAAGWNGDATGESLWSYSLRLGGSHALLNGWVKNAGIRNILTVEENRSLEAALAKSMRARADGPKRRQEPRRK
ncbi:MULTISPECIES: hypothetical protein [Streptomyces]|uniref:hypothetical protein n=1 Tax=Streptomyces TaxID=1883 RepID=UPI001586FA90|nr:hypothetical protein [Streptomyces sp. CAI-85]MBO7934617.1 hypothetical protein [Streptomyces sp. S9]NUV59595.1 hypothetical protein [Streptomyces sp. CAI-85]